MGKILINSFVHANVQEDSCLFYNTLNGKYVIIKNPLFSHAVAQLMESTENNYLLPATALSDEDIHSLTEAWIGTLIEDNHTPFQFFPRTYIDGYTASIFPEGIESVLSDEESEIKKEKKKTEYLSLMGKNILTYLTVINIHYSSLSAPQYIPYQCAHKQYLYPQVGISCAINLEKTKEFIIEWKYINRVNLIVGDINENDIKIINEFILYLKDMDIPVNLYGEICHKDILSSILSNHSYYWITGIDSNLNINISKQDNLTLLGLICEENDFEFVEALCEENNIFACATSCNEQFCVESSGYNQEEITQEIISEARIRTNSTLNTNLFGTLWIYPDDKVYSCPNDKELGYIDRNTLKEVLYKEFTVSKSWFKIRKEYISCKNCLFNCLCPPITNYELCLKKKLCNLK